MSASSGNYETLIKALVDPTRSYLRERVKDMGYPDDQLLPLIDRAVNRGVSEVKTEIALGRLNTEPRFLRATLEKAAYDYVVLVLSQTDKWTITREKIKSYNSVVVMGAGISFESGIPLTATLSDILRFCHSKSWGGLRSDLKKCLKFKKQFKDACDSKNPGIGHETIVYAFPNRIREIICLNWDNLLEKAAVKLARSLPKVNEDIETKGITKGFLWKFHGDVEAIKTDNKRGKGGWIFPDEGGYIFPSFKKYLKESGLRDDLFVLVIVGYSESDEKIVKEIIQALEKKPPRPVYRLSLDLDKIEEENYIVGPADFILPRILVS